jgi:phosphoadenosine phosphosulfate reductase
MNSQVLGLTETQPAQLSPELDAKLAHVRALLRSELSGTPPQSASSIEVGKQDACITCSFQAEDVLLLYLALELRKDIPVLFLDTGYHFAETYAYRDRIAADWHLNLIDLIPANTVAQQEAEFGMLHQSEPNRCCQLRKVEPLFAAVANYKIWLTGLRREQARTRAALEEAADFTLPGGVIVRKLSPFADWTTRDVWQLCEHFNIPLLPLYDLGYASIGCEPCTSIPTDPNDPRSGRWAGRKVECGIHIQTVVSGQ